MVDELSTKKTELVKYLIIESIKELKFGGGKK